MLKLILLVPLLAYGAFALYIFFFADGMIFLPPAASYQHQPATDPSAINILTGNGEVIAATYLQNPDSPYTILYSHGNASDIGTVLPILKALYSQGFSVLAYDYPGYGYSPGKPTESNAYNAIEVAYSYLTNTLKVPPEKIILHGQSLGGGPSTYLATKQPVAGLILESTFATIFQVAVPLRILPFEKFANVRRIGKINCPLLLIHGEKDETIPISHSQELLAAAHEPKQLVTITGANHSDLLWVGGETYLNTIHNFARSLSQQYE
ncbi:MAG: alpha/beta hydrolase [Phormidesmis sp.]